jgi:hypothetical protein
MWGDPDGLALCNSPGLAKADEDHAGGKQDNSQSQVAADHQASPDLAQLVQAMASHFAVGGASFDFGSSSRVTVDPGLQTAIAIAWHQ